MKMKHEVPILHLLVAFVSIVSLHIAVIPIFVMLAAISSQLNVVLATRSVLLAIISIKLQRATQTVRIATVTRLGKNLMRSSTFCIGFCAIFTDRGSSLLMLAKSHMKMLDELT